MRTARLAGHLLLGTIALAALAVTVLAVGWRVTGGTWYLVESPSMGTAAPVETLLLDRPPGRIAVGELVTFHPPASDQTFTHRVVAILANGGVKTKGDANSSADGWVLTPSDIVGVVDARLWYVGWVIRALPVLAVGGFVVWLLTRYLVRAPGRPVARVVGLVVVAALAVVIVKPLVGYTVVTLNKGDGHAYGTVVSTGLLPIEVRSPGGTHIYLADGQVGTVMTPLVAGVHHYRVDITPHWTLWWVLSIGVICLSPALYASLRGLPEEALKS
ncbi:MAG: S24/S26 family peptidase [Acidimicrobiales bacterium]